MTTGFVCGAFDLLHAGHILMLKEAKDHCDYLIVAVQTDPTIDRPQNKNKPVQSIFERVTQLDACMYVDELLVYETEKDLLNILASYSIDVRFLDETYIECPTRITGPDLVPIHYTKRKHSYSSSELKERIRRS